MRDGWSGGGQVGGGLGEWKKSAYIYKKTANSIQMHFVQETLS